MKFEEKLMTLRKEKGWSQEDLSNKIGVSRQTISKWESSQTAPDMHKLIELSKIFEISIDELINEEEKKPEEKEDNKIYTKINLKPTNILLILSCILIIIGLIFSIIIYLNNGEKMYVEDIVMVTYDYIMEDTIEVIEIYSFDSNEKCIGINVKISTKNQEDYESIINDINKNNINDGRYNIVLNNNEITWSIKGKEDETKKEILEILETTLTDVQNLKITDM